MSVAAIVIGRNEGERLLRCLASLKGKAAPIIYVDSGSSDGSQEAARATGADVVALDMSTPFTAARARNAGLAQLKDDSCAYVQVIDGDCEMRSDWIDTAAAFLDAHPKVGVVAGRLRERHPEATYWNRLADIEWDTPEGETSEVGGIALLRRKAIASVDGYREDLIAGEEPEMCLRLRQNGWLIWRLADEMAWHDIAMTRFSQWWRRTRRAGHAYAEGAILHGKTDEHYRVGETRRALIWGAGVPLLGLVALTFTWWGAVLPLLLWSAQIFRLSRKGIGWKRAFFLTLGKIAEAQGVLSHWIMHARGRRLELIEYK